MRIKRMKARNECLEQLKNETRNFIVSVYRSKPEYKETLKKLIVQVSIESIVGCFNICH